MNNKNFDKYRPLAFFGIKIDESEESIKEWVRWCKEKGFRGFNIIVATDCDGRANDEWISMLLKSYRIAIEEAKKAELEVWIFDDWGYPSGTAGGLVCGEEAYRAKKMIISLDYTVQPHTCVSLELPTNCIAVGVISDMGYKSIPIGDKLSYTAGEQTERLIAVSWEYDRHQSKSSCKSYQGDPYMSCIDMLNPNATRKFISVMHDMYYKEFSEYFGSTIKGFFYDEPFLSFEFPWTENLESEFFNKKGYSLNEVLPQILALSGKLSTPEVDMYIRDYFDVWTDMAAESYYGEMSRWCREHGVELSGHQDLDHRLNTLNTMSGHFYKNMTYNSRPAVDVIWKQIEAGAFADFPRYAGSARRLLGKERATSETFAGMGQGLFGDLMRYITEHQIIRGINDFYLMYSNNSPSDGGIESPQMPNNMMQNHFAKEIYERIGKMCALASKGTPQITTALFIPTISIHRQQLSAGDFRMTNLEKPIWTKVDEIAEYLCYMPYEFDYIWSEAIEELPVVNGGIMTKSGYVIDTLILSPHCVFDDKLTQKLAHFTASGGTIISMYNRVDGIEATVCGELYELNKYLKKPVEISGNNKISLHISKNENETIYMLLNESNQTVFSNIKINANGIIKEYDISNGIEKAAESEFESIFAPRELKIFKADKCDADEFEKSGELKLDEWQIELPNGKKCMINGDTLPDWCELGYPEYSGLMKYTAEFDWQGVENAILKINGLRYHAIVKLDGAEKGKIIFSPYELLIQNITKGRHCIEIEVHNTMANAVCGTPEAEKNYPKRFYHLLDYDKQRINSGMVEAPKLIGVVKKKKKIKEQ